MKTITLVFALCLFVQDLLASGFGGPGVANPECIPEYSNKYSQSSLSFTEEELGDLLKYGEDGVGRSVYTEKDGFLLLAAPSEITKLNLGMDTISQRYVDRVLEGDPLVRLAYSTFKKQYVTLDRDQFRDSREGTGSYEYSDCTAIQGKEKRLFFKIRVGQHFKDGKYIYGIKDLGNGEVKILLGNPAKIDKEKLKNKHEKFKQISNSVVGEETLSRDEIFRQVEISARNQSKTGAFNYAITEATEVCFDEEPTEGVFSDMGCANYQGFGGKGDPGGFCPSCTIMGDTGPTKPTRPINSGKK